VRSATGAMLRRASSAAAIASVKSFVY
jgi:hypothetical protein